MTKAERALEALKNHDPSPPFPEAVSVWVTDYLLNELRPGSHVRTLFLHPQQLKELRAEFPQPADLASVQHHGD